MSAIGTRIAGLAVTAVAGWFMAGRASRSEIWQTQSDSFEMDAYYRNLKAEHGYGAYSGTGMDGAASGFRRFMVDGPFGLFRTARNAWSNAAGFTRDVLISPFTPFAAAGLYMAGLRGKHIAGAGKALWNTKLIQNIGKGISFTFGKLLSGNTLQKGIGLLAKSGWAGAVVAGLLAVAAFQFVRVVNGSAQENLFKDYSSTFTYP